MMCRLLTTHVVAIIIMITWYSYFSIMQFKPVHIDKGLKNSLITLAMSIQQLAITLSPFYYTIHEELVFLPYLLHSDSKKDE